MLSPHATNANAIPATRITPHGQHGQPGALKVASYSYWKHEIANVEIVPAPALLWCVR
jgi:hypothetical protein